MLRSRALSRLATLGSRHVWNYRKSKPASSRSLLRKCLLRCQGLLCTSIRPENALLRPQEARFLSFRGLPTADSVDLASRRTFATGLYVERVLLKAISALPRKRLLAAVISLPASAGRHRAGVRPNPGTGGGSDRFNRPGWGPSMSLVGPPRHVLRVLNGCVGTRPGFRTSLGDAGHEL